MSKKLIYKTSDLVNVVESLIDASKDGRDVPEWLKEYIAALDAILGGK